MSKWQNLSSDSRNVLSAIIDEGRINVKESLIRRCLQEKYGMGKNASSSAIRKAKLEFINTDLVKLIVKSNMAMAYMQKGC